jgi:hypothetical protein
MWSKPRRLSRLLVDGQLATVLRMTDLPKRLVGHASRQEHGVRHFLVGRD